MNRVARQVSKPALNRLADRIADGRAPGRPVRAGLFMVVGSIIDPVTGNVGLITDPDASGRSGFVRSGGRGIGGAQPRRDGPFYNLNIDLIRCHSALPPIESLISRLRPRWSS